MNHNIKKYLLELSIICLSALRDTDGCQENL